MRGFAPAQIEWQQDSEGRQIPRSLDFDECYYSSQDGLAETRHVFLAGNRLAFRFLALAKGSRFVIAETGFGVGLNFLATAKLWQQSGSRGELHYLSTELFGVSKSDLRQAHASFAELDAFSDQLITQYPDLIPGVHRLHFPDLKITLDLWFGEASDSLAKMVAPSGVDAWFLDGFSPRQNLEMWAESVFKQIARLSHAGTTAATFSAARAVKLGLIEAGFMISKTRGFGNKRHMIQAIRAPSFGFIPRHPAADLTPKTDPNHTNPPSDTLFQHTHGAVSDALSQPLTQTKASFGRSINLVAVVGAGIAGLCAAYKLASSGRRVTLFEGKKPLSGSSGNPRAMLAPKITPYACAADHLHTQSFLYASRFYAELARAHRLPQLFQACGVVDQPKQRSPDQWPALIQGYPKSFVQMHPLAKSIKTTGNLSHKPPSLLLPSAGILSPHLIAQSILAHPLIQLRSAKVTSVTGDGHIEVDGQLCRYDQVVICAGSGTQHLMALGDAARTTKGQISWIKCDTDLTRTKCFIPLAQKFGGYAIADQFNVEEPKLETRVLFGATNERNYDPKDSERVTQAAHLANLQKLKTDCAELFKQISSSTQTTTEQGLLDHLQGRASIRFQLPDHMPLCGSITDRLSVISALGSKGFCYAPYTAELLKNLLLLEPNMASLKTLERLDPRRYSPD